jgi:hypothetical protein
VAYHAKTNPNLTVDELGGFLEKDGEENGYMWTVQARIIRIITSSTLHTAQ